MRHTQTRLSLAIFAFILPFLFAPKVAKAQKPGAANPGAASPSPSSNNSPAASPSGGGLQGVTVARESWNAKLVKQDPKVLGLRNPKDMVFVCYKLLPGNSAAQPFILERDSIPSPWLKKSLYEIGAMVAPLKSNGYYYQAEIALQSGTTAPNFDKSGGLAPDNPGSPSTYALYWKDMGNAKKDQPISSWQASHGYADGELVLAPSPSNGHFYQAVIGIKSTANMPNFLNGETTPELTANSGLSGLSWRDRGKGDANFLQSLQSWQRDHLYQQGDVIAPGDGDSYEAEIDFGRRETGEKEPAWNTEPGTKAPDTSGQLSWKNLGLGITNPNIQANCTNITPSQPLLMDQLLVVAIDVTAIPKQIMDRFKILNLNITNQQGTSLNPTPIRPSLAAGTASGAPTSTLQFGEGVASTSYFLTWPNQLPGDTIPTISVNIVYTPVAPALRWEQRTFYPAGSIVLPNDNNNTNGHYYLAINSGISGDLDPSFNNAVTLVPMESEGSGLSWKDMGLTPPSTTSQTWQARHTYGVGELVVPPPNKVTGHYYRAEHSGQADSSPPDFSSARQGMPLPDGHTLVWIDMGPIALMPAPSNWTQNAAYASGAQVIPVPPNGHYYQALTAGVTGPYAPPFPVDGSQVTETTGVKYVDAGTSLPSGAKLRAWAEHTAFFLNDAILDPRTGHYYLVVQAGISGSPDAPTFEVPAPKILPGGTSAQPIVWQDLGTTLPASVSAGTPPSDQTVNLLTYTFPQSHALSRFNLASGVVVSSIRSKSFTNLNASTATTPNWTTTNNGLIVDPILAVSVYIKPLDAERRFHTSDLIPAPTMAFSLSSPSTNFYFGASSELFIRNLQVVYGLSIAKTAVLQPAKNQLSGTTPATQQVFLKGGFVGVSFNITGFIQSLFIPH